MPRPTLIFATFMAPTLYKTYQSITEYIERALGIPTFLICGESLDDFENGYIDAGFICGLSYIHLVQQRAAPVELVAAPILQGERYRHEPLYFSDIIVHARSNVKTLDDLRGATWAYNEKESHSGYNLVEYSLLQQNRPASFFGQMIESGSHGQSLRMVLEGRADAAAIDSHMLDVVLRNSSGIASQLRVVDSFGPSSVPPIVAAARLDATLKNDLQQALLVMHEHMPFAQQLHEGCIEHFTTINDDHYHDIRAMYHCVQSRALALAH